MIFAFKKLWWLLLVLPLVLACQEDPKRGDSSDLSSGLLTESGEYLGLKLCSDDLDTAALCYQDSAGSESPSQKYTFVLCRDGVNSELSECVPVFWSDKNAPLRVEMSGGSVGRHSELARDLADMRKQLAGQENMNRAITGGLAIGSGVSYGIHRMAHVRGLAGHSVSLKFVSVAMAVLAVGHYLISAVGLPSLNKKFFGRSTGTLPTIDQGDSLLPYYQPNKAEQSFIKKSEGIFQSPDLAPVPLKDRDSMTSFIELLGESLVHHKAATTDNLHKICLPNEQQDSSVLTCTAVQSAEQSTLDAKVALEAVADEQKLQLASSDLLGDETSETSGTSGTSEIAGMTTVGMTEEQGGVKTELLGGGTGGTGEIKIAGGAEEQGVGNKVNASQKASGSELLSGVTEQEVSSPFNQVFAGISYLDLIDPSTHGSCQQAGCLSTYWGEGNIYVVEGHFNCLVFGGGEACNRKYRCGYVPKDQASCLKLAKTLGAIKEHLNYMHEQFYVAAKNYCGGL